MSLTLGQSDFRLIAEFAHRRWGLHLPEGKARLVESRLTKFLRKSPFDSIQAYVDHISNRATDEELLEFFDLLSTNTTSFFRESQHFDFLRDHFYPRFTSAGGQRKLRIWSAACSNGAEPYSLVIHVLENLRGAERMDFKLLATDLSNGALRLAREARYCPKDLEQMDPALVKRYFRRVEAPDDRTMQVTPDVRARVSIHQLNLMDRWPMSGPFDVVFLRNVMIYFNKETRDRLVSRMVRLLSPGGVFVIGSAETVPAKDFGLRVAQPSVYVK